MVEPKAKLPPFGELRDGYVEELRMKVSELPCRPPLQLRLRQPGKSEVLKNKSKLSKRVKMIPYGATKDIHYFGTIRQTTWNMFAITALHGFGTR